MTLDEFVALTGKEFSDAAEKAVEPYTHVEHYTSVHAALGIIRDQCLWFSNVANMNDISEMIAGCRIAYEVWEHSKASFSRFGGLGNEILSELQHRFTLSQGDTYAFCLCGHDPSQPSGRLPLWRGYGADGNGVCLVLKRQPIIQARILDFPIHWIPMIYERPEQLVERVQRYVSIVDRTLTDHPNLVENHRPQVVGTVAHSLLLLGVSHKHVQFSYENEIRLIHFKPFESLIAERMWYDAEVIRGALQPFVKVKVVDYSDHDLPGTRLSDILERVVVGPSHVADMQLKAFQYVLARAGLENVQVQKSDIPYRSGRLQSGLTT